jgi:hypothetical protein
MDGFTEKKWFVYLGDHHEGAFSLEEIQSKIGQGQLSGTNYIWAEGMADWKMMSEVDSFHSVLRQPAKPVLPVSTAAAASSASFVDPMASANFVESTQMFQTVEPVSIHPNVNRSITAAPILSSTSREEVNTGPEDLSMDASTNELLDEPLKSSHHRKALASQMIKIGALFLVLGGVGFAFNEGYMTPLFNSQTIKSAGDAFASAADPVLSTLSDKLPFLAGFLSPIPKLENVAPEEFEQLKVAAKTKLDQGGPQIAIALDQSDLLNPTFYVGTNLPDGAILDIYIEGIPDTLLNQLSFTAKAQATVLKRFAHSGAIEFSQGKAFPRGQYNLYVVDPETQPATVKPLLARMVSVQSVETPVSVPKGLRIIATKSYFFGGLRDALYTARLKEFHDKLIAKSQQELTELKQIVMTYESQLGASDQKFKALRKGKKPTPGQKKAWGDFSAQWDKMNEQLVQTFSKLTPANAQTDYFYGFLYQIGQQTADSVGKLHTLQSTYFAGTVQDPKAFDIQVGEVAAIAHSAVETMKAKIDQIEKLPPTASGLPKRDGF